MRARMLDGPAPTFAEDKVVVEAQQAMMDRRPDAPFVMIASDAGMAHARRLVKALLDAQRNSAVSATGATNPAVSAANQLDTPTETP